MSYHTNADTVVRTFEAPMQGMALGLASVLILQRQARMAERREANALRAVAGRMAYDRVMQQHAYDEAERQARSDFDRRRQAIRLRALAAKRAQG